MVTFVVALTAVVVIGNVAKMAPGRTVTDGGTDASAVLELDSATVVPDVGAAISSVTLFPVLCFPPTIDAGASVILSNHSEYDGAYTKARLIAAPRQPGEDNPFVVGTDSVQRYFSVMAECATASKLRVGAQ